MEATPDAVRAPDARRAIVIPMYEEAARIGPSLAVLAEALALDAGLEVVLVDDGSTDDTAEVAGKAAADLGLRHVVVRLPVNQGKGAAVRAGMLATTAAARVFVDADLSVGVTDLIRCFQAIESGAADLAYATRAHPDSVLPRRQPMYRVVSGRTYNMFLRRLGLTTERDTQCGMKGFSAAVADEVFGALSTSGFGFDVEVLARAERGGWRVQPIPVTWSHVDESRVRALRDGLRMVRSAVAVRRELGPRRA